VREPNYDLLTRTGRLTHDPPRFMSVAAAAEQLLAVEAARGEGVCGPATRAVGLARVGQPSQAIVSGTLEELAGLDLGPPLHSLVLCAPGGATHELELAMLEAARWEAAEGGAGGREARPGQEGHAGVRRVPRVRAWSLAAEETSGESSGGEAG